MKRFYVQAGTRLAGPYTFREDATFVASALGGTVVTKDEEITEADKARARDLYVRAFGDEQ